jgi:hypothetical protein
MTDDGADRGGHGQSVEYTEGGDPVCWLDRVCEECGAFREDPSARACARCGTPFPDERQQDAPQPPPS